MTDHEHLPSPVPNRPLNALDIADGAFALLRGRPRTVAALAAAFVLPVQLITAWADRNVFSTFSLDNFDTETGQFEGQNDFTSFGAFGGSTIGTVLEFLILPFLGVALTHLVLGWRQGVDRGALECLTFTMRKSHIILAVFVLSKVIQVVTLLLTTPMLMLLAPIIAAEGLGPLAAITRAFQLGRRRYGHLLGLLLLIVLINFLLTYALLGIPVLGAFLLGDWGWIAFFALGSIGTTVLTILGTGAAVLAYFETRDRVEGDDILRRVQVARGIRA